MTQDKTEWSDEKWATYEHIGRMMQGGTRWGTTSYYTEDISIPLNVQDILNGEEPGYMRCTKERVLTAPEIRLYRRLWKRYITVTGTRRRTVYK